ncbi:hypothetical protein DVH24_042039 [Malus domestica]|uniref:Uncharacterized protein n=1 Tax=Malus domestica TaxID=3750 RepID=A0A498IV44_MALDO|nr:hypothetical protein DVH24_042039 [Malus domestica]
MKIDENGNSREKLGYNGNFKFATADVDWTRKRCLKRRCHYASRRSNMVVWNAYELWSGLLAIATVPFPVADVSCVIGESIPDRSLLSTKRYTARSGWLVYPFVYCLAISLSKD